MGKMKAKRDRLLRHIRNVHPDAVTALRAQRIEPADASLTELAQAHDAIPHTIEDDFSGGGRR